MSNQTVSKKVTPGAARPRVAMIAAVAANRVIGAGNRMPWHLPEDLRHFKATTLGHPVIMGRKTWDSIGRPLPGRRNVVVSRQRGLQLQGAQLAASLQDALAQCTDVEEVFVIGGGELYREALPLASRVVLTEIAQAFDGDTRFPALDAAEWRETARLAQTSAAGLRFDFVRYERR